MNKTAPTIVNGRLVEFKRNSEGKRFAVIDNSQVLPLEILPLCCGPDAWLSQLTVRCDYCKAPHIAKEMEQGSFGLQCQACFASAFEDDV